MMFKLNKTLVLLPTTLLAACSVTPPQPPPAPEPSPNREVIEALNQINQLESELQELRNLVEIQQFELENLRKRQNDLYGDLDKRLTATENIKRGTQSGFDTQSPDLDSTTGTGEDDIPIIDLDTNSDTTVSEPTPPISSQQEVASADTAYQQGFEHLKKGEYPQAIKSFQGLIDQFPQSPQADDSYYWIGEAQFVTRDYQSALVNFKTMIERYPDSERVPEAMLKIGYIQYDTRAYPEARQTLTDLIQNYPDHQVVPAARTRLQRMTNEGN